MEDINQMHQLNIEWGCVTNLMDKISSIEGTIDGGWPELIDMVADAMCEEGEMKDPASVFLNLYGFLWRLFYRLKSDSTPRPFNKYERLKWGSYKEDVFVVHDYDYKVYKWAMKSGFGSRISNNSIIIPVNKLTTEQQRAFDRRCNQEV